MPSLRSELAEYDTFWQANKAVLEAYAPDIYQRTVNTTNIPSIDTLANQIITNFDPIIPSSHPNRTALLNVIKAYVSGSVYGIFESAWGIDKSIHDNWVKTQFSPILNAIFADGYKSATDISNLTSAIYKWNQFIPISSATLAIKNPNWPTTKVDNYSTWTGFYQGYDERRQYYFGAYGNYTDAIAPSATGPSCKLLFQNNCQSTQVAHCPNGDLPTTNT